MWGTSVNSRNLVGLHTTLPLVPAGSGVCCRAPPSSLVFLYGSWFFFFGYSEARWLREWCVVGAVHEQWDTVSREICISVAYGGASFPAWPQLSVTATAVILPGEGKVMAWERYFRAEFWSTLGFLRGHSGATAGHRREASQSFAFHLLHICYLKRGSVLLS